MSKKAQVLMLILWILVILTLLAVGIGHRVSMALRLSGYQRDKLKASCLAKAAINKAIVELEKDKDTSDYDAFNESWADNEGLFKKISFDDSQNEFATINYETIEDGQQNTVFGVRDEERKININRVPEGLLIELFDKRGISDTAQIANNICAWRGDTGKIVDYTDLGYSNKGDKFATIEELMLVKDIDQKTYSVLKDAITVYGEGKININTVSKGILEILIDYCRKQIPDIENESGDLVDRIMQVRPANSFSNLQGKLNAQGSLNSGQNNILNELQKVTDFKSSCFYIISNGKINKYNYLIHCIFDRDNRKIIYWHEG